ncbi:methyl-accepting chemotaxis protein [Gammaproteobacteria bacterium]
MQHKNIRLIFVFIASYFLLFVFLLLHQGLSMQRFSDEIVNNWMPSIVAVNAINTATSNLRAAEAMYLMSSDSLEKNEYEQDIQRNEDIITSWQIKYEPLISSDKERALYQTFSKSYADYLVASKQVLFLSQNSTNEATPPKHATSSNEKAANSSKPNTSASTVVATPPSGPNQKAVVQLKRSGNLFESYSDDLLKLVTLNRAGAEENARQGEYTFDRTKMTLISGNAILWFLLLVSSVMLGRMAPKGATIIRIKTLLAFLGIALVSGGFEFLFYQQLARSNAQIAELNTNWIPSIIAVNLLDTANSDYRMNESLHLLSTDAEEMAKIDRDLEQLVNQVAKLQEGYVKLISSPEEQNTYNQFLAGYKEYLAASRETLGYSRRNENEQAGQQIKMSASLFNSFTSDLKDLVMLNEQGGIQSGHLVAAALDSLKIVTLSSVVLAMLLLMISAQLVRSWLIEPPLPLGVTEGMGFLSIKWKLRSAFAGMIVAVVFVSVFATGWMATMNDQSHELEKSWVPSIILVNAINTLTSDYRIAEAQHIMTTSPAAMTRWDKKLKRISNTIQNTRSRYEPLISSDEERDVYRRFSQKYALYMASSEKLLASSRRNENEAATKLFHHGQVMFDAFSEDLLRLVDINSSGGTDAAQISGRIFDKAQQMFLAVLMGVLFLIILFSILFDRNISVALLRLTGKMQDLSRGIVSVEQDAVMKTRRDEIGQMANALGAVTNTLQTLTGDSNRLIQAAQNGEFSVRVEAGSHPGEFRKIVAGMNQLIELLSKPLSEIALIMENLALGELSNRIRGDYKGELHILKTNVNRSLDDLVALLSELGEALQAMANSDLTHPLHNNYQGEFSILKKNANQTIDQMTTILREISGSTHQSAISASETAGASKYVASEASRQMGAIDEISRTIEETAISIREISEKSTQGHQLATLTTKLAHDGQALLHKLIALIQNIDAEYGKIEKITDQITRIADKTHLLSLNAGLEAMRAGEHGLSFGFVAQQIGSLADEVSTSARNIGDVIDSSGQKIRLSVHAAQETQKSIEQIAEAAQSNEKTAQHISIAVVQQSGAVQVLTQRIDEIRSSSNGTASAAEEISNTMAALAQMVSATAEQAGRFKLIEERP